ncbi:hypothetical protein F52700_13607 [Fusarium sp. NRRL 52700]|nr:hypothetical protein F52700_13607 [Fusarium sp. NRRL 52700]
MKTSMVILTVFAALAAASPVPEPEPQCAGCEPSDKGSSGASSNSNSNNTNNNSNSNSNEVNVGVGGGSSGGGSGGNSSGGGSGGSTGAHTCDECIAFCTGRADLLDALCKAIVCGIDQVVIMWIFDLRIPNLSTIAIEHSMVIGHPMKPITTEPPTSPWAPTDENRPYDT